MMVAGGRLVVPNVPERAMTGRGIPDVRLRTALPSCCSPMYSSWHRPNPHMKLLATPQRCRDGRLPSTSCIVATSPVHTTSFENIYSEQGTSVEGVLDATLVIRE